MLHNLQVAARNAGARAKNDPSQKGQVPLKLSKINACRATNSAQVRCNYISYGITSINEVLARNWSWSLSAPLLINIIIA